MAVGFGAPQAPLAGAAGPVSALGAGGGPVALVVGGFAQRGGDDPGLGGGEDDGVLACSRSGRRGFGLRGWRYLGVVGGGGGFLAAFVDAGQVAQEADVSIPWKCGHFLLADSCNFPLLLTIERQFT